MNIYIQVKAAGRRRLALNNILYEIPNNITTLRAFLTELVKIEVMHYNQKDKDVQVISFLTREEIEAHAEAGKVSFGRIYSDKKVDIEKAVENALQCFIDGLVRVFQNDNELTKLDEPIQIQEGDCFTLIRLTFLAGRLW